MHAPGATAFAPALLMQPSTHSGSAPRRLQPVLAHQRACQPGKLRHFQLSTAAPQLRRLHATAVQAPKSIDDAEYWTPEAKEMYLGYLDRFKLADTDGNGVIDRDELWRLLEAWDDGRQSAAQHWLSEAEVDAIMRKYDTDANGTISFDEYVALAQDGVLLEGKVDEYEAAFAAVDADGNGTVDVHELGTLLAVLGRPLAPEQLAAVFEEYDVDKSGEIEFPEFLRMFRGQLLDLSAILAYLSLRAAPAASDGDRGTNGAVQAGAQTAAASATAVDAPAADTAAASASASSSQAASLPMDHGVYLLRAEPDFECLKAECAKAGRLLVLMSSLTWCRPCLSAARPVEKLASYYEGVTFAKLEGNASESAKHVFKDILKTRVTPTFFFFRNGEVVHSHGGANKLRLEHYLRGELSPAESPEDTLWPVPPPEQPAPPPGPSSPAHPPPPMPAAA